jgi:MFS family permease
MTGIVSGGISFGTLVLPPITAQLISAYNWRTTYIVIGAAILVLVMIAAQFLKPGPPGTESQIETPDKARSSFTQESRGFSLGEAVHTRQFWMVAGIYLCFGTTQLTIMVHIVPQATGMGNSPINAAAILSIVGGVSLASRILIGIITDRIGVKTSAVLCLSIITVSFFWLQWVDSLWKLYFFAVIFGFGYGGMSCLQSLIAAELFGLLSLGVLTAIFSFSFNIGGAAGPVLAGYVFDVSGSYRWAFLACTLVIGIALIISLSVKPPLQK